MAREHEELQKHTFHLYRGDYAKLQALFPELGAAIIIRKLVRQYLDNTKGPQDSTLPDTLKADTDDI